MWIITVCLILLVVGYLVWTAAPAAFLPKGLSRETLRSLAIVAHRGGAELGLENTLSCIEKGLAAGADAIEIDVHLTKDGHLVVCHDETADRTTDGTGAIRDMTLEQIRQLHVTDSDGNITDEYLPTLDEVLSLVDGRAVLLIEVKRTGDNYIGIEEKILCEIDRHGAAAWTAIQSFNDSVLENTHALNPAQRLEKLIIFKFPGLPLIFDGTFTRFSFDKYSYAASINIYHEAARRSFVNKILSHGKEVKLWTLDDPSKVPTLPVSGIITDRPDLWHALRTGE